jgi:hypothetical protein
VLAEEAEGEERVWREQARVIFLTIVGAGLRRGELLGLHWRDLALADPAGPRLRVRETWVRGGRETPKSEAGERTIALGPRLADELFQHRGRSAFQGEDERVWFLQEWFDLAQSDPFTEQQYLEALARARSLGRELGIDFALQKDNLNALVAPTASPSWPIDLVNGDHFLGASSSPAAIAGYPLLAVPAGEAFGLPVGISFMGTAFSEPTLIKIASGFENATKARRKPEFLPTLPFDNPPQSLHSAHALKRMRRPDTQLARPERPLMI